MEIHDSNQDSTINDRSSNQMFPWGLIWWYCLSICGSDRSEPQLCIFLFQHAATAMGPDCFCMCTGSMCVQFVSIFSCCAQRRKRIFDFRWLRSGVEDLQRFRGWNYCMPESSKTLAGDPCTLPQIYGLCVFLSCLNSRHKARFGRETYQSRVGTKRAQYSSEGFSC